MNYIFGWVFSFTWDDYGFWLVKTQNKTNVLYFLYVYTVGKHNPDSVFCTQATYIQIFHSSLNSPIPIFSIQNLKADISCF